MDDFKLILIPIIVVYGLFLHFKKEDLNHFLDLYSPGWYTDCAFCRGVEFGTLLGIMIGLLF